MKLSDVPVSPPLAWSPDGRYLAAQRVVPPTGLYLIPIDGGEPRPIVTSKPPRSDRSPAFSPDGRRFAYGSCATPMFGCDVYVLDLDRALAPMSSPRRLTRSAVFLLGSLAWTRDGRSVIYNSLDPLITYLWRVAVDGNHAPERIEVAGLGAAMPATTLSSDRLAFVRIVVDTDVYRFQAGRPSQPVLASSFLETETRFSPDGRRLAFSSMRAADTFNIWLAAADGSDAQQLTRGPGSSRARPGGRPTAAKSRLMRIPMIGTLISGRWTPMGAQCIGSRLTPAIRMSRTGPVTAGGFTSPTIAGLDATFGAWRPPVVRRSKSPGAAAAISRASRPTGRAFCISRRTKTRRCSRCHSAEVPRGSSSPA